MRKFSIENSLFMQKYSVNQYLVSNLLNWVQSKEIAIPEIQRPFVWNSTNVRDLMDSLYRGYPIGYIIAWKNPDVRLKDGSISNGKKILIDGQQRITALRAAILGESIINKDYKEEKYTYRFTLTLRSSLRSRQRSKKIKHGYRIFQNCSIKKVGYLRISKNTVIKIQKLTGRLLNETSKSFFKSEINRSVL